MGDGGDRRDDGRCATGAHLGELIDGLDADGLAQDGQIQFRGQVAEAVVGDAWQNRRGIGGQVATVSGDADEVGGAELIDGFTLPGVEIEGDGKAFGFGIERAFEGGGVVTGELGLAGSGGGGSTTGSAISSEESTPSPDLVDPVSSIPSDPVDSVVAVATWAGSSIPLSSLLLVPRHDASSNTRKKTLTGAMVNLMIHR